VRYIHLNPIRAKLVTTIGALGDYRYSGHSALVGAHVTGRQNTEYVVAHFSPDQKKARRLYREFVEKGVLQGRRSDLTGGGVIRSNRG
jgi:hypothetical protein